MFTDDTVPRGWNFNPSGFQDRATVLVIAFLGLVTVGPDYDLWNFLIELNFVLITLLAFFGSEDRWRTKPWLIALFGVFAGIISFCLSLGSLLQMASSYHWQTRSIARATLALLTVGPAADEVLASLQFLRLEMKQGRKLWNSFWGLRPKWRRRIPIR
jgi:hypothetical protein